MATTKVQPDFLQSLLDRLHQARQRTDHIFSLLRGQALHERPIPERHRLIFYLGHLEAFDWNLIGKGALGLKTAHEGMDERFAFGIDPVDGKLPHDQPCDWPREEAVRAYNERLRDRMDSALRTDRDHFTENLANGILLNVAIEHRLMHAETLAYLLQQMPYESKEKPEDYTSLSGVEKQTLAARRQMIEIPPGEAPLGLRRNAGSFGWDNEFEENKIRVPAFRIRAYPVTNVEFLEFLNAGGYESEQLWDSDAWRWRKSSGLSHPLFWNWESGDWKYRGVFEEIPLPLDWPVYVSHAEASAFARWSKKKLPSEPQWHRAAYSEPSGERAFPWGNESPNPKRGNFDFQRWDPESVAAHPGGQSAFGVHDLLGNGWEWTSSIFGPFPGFEPFPFYRGYSANFFDGKHFVMKGGSARTAACMLRRSFRNWFQPHYPYVFAKFRLVEV